MKFSKKFFVLCAVFVFSLASLSAQKTVRVGYYECDETLQTGFSDDARKSGYFYDFYQKVAEYTDWVYEYEYGSYDEIIQKLYDGKVDIVAGLTKTDKYKGNVLFPDHKMGTFSYTIYAPLGMDSTDEMVREMGKVRIAMRKNTYIRYELMEAYANQFGFNYEPVPYASVEDRRRAYVNGEFDYILTLDSERLENFKPAYSLGSIDIYFAVSKMRPDLLRELDEAMDRLYDSFPGYVNKLADKYFNILEDLSLTKDEKIYLYDMKKIRFGYVTNAMPISASDSSGNIHGLAKNVADYLQDYLGVEVVPVPYSGSEELKTGLLNRNIDVAYPMFTDAWVAEEQGYKQTESFVGHRMMLVYKGEYRPDLFDKIGIGKSTIGQRQYLEKYYPNAELVEYDTRADYFDAVERGEVNCSLGNESILQRFIRENPKYSDLNIVYLPHTEDFGLAVNVDKPLLLESLNKAVQHLDQSILINALVSYAYIEKPFSFISFFKQYAVVLVLILLVLILGIVLVFYNYIKNVHRMRAREEKSKAVIKEAYIASANANNAKSAFLANMSHDIRTPVNAIIGMSALATCNIGDQNRVNDCLQKISTSSKNLLEIINNILDMSKIEAGSMGLNLAPFNVSDLMQSLSQDMKKDADAKNIQLSISTQKVKHYDVISDGNRLRQVFVHLIENAIHFTQNGGKVDVIVSELPSSSPKMGCYEFVFQDNGCGISDEFKPKLFQPFMREEDEKISPVNAGTGLGLAISRNIIQMMGGDIRVQSRVGEGSKFTVTVFMEWQLENEEESQADDADENEITVEQFSKCDFTGKRALLVEDNDLNAEFASEILKMAKLDVELAVDGMEAINKILSTPDGYYDIIFMDVQMPVMNGYETTAAIRSYDSDYMQNIPIITMTANAFADDISHAKNSGMNEHLSKPLKLNRLMKVLNKWLGDGEDDAQTNPEAEILSLEDLNRPLEDYLK